jgi:methyl-accepting chemotaxis protein
MKLTITQILRYTIFGLGGLSILNFALVNNNIRNLGSETHEIEALTSLQAHSQRMVKWHLAGDNTQAQASTQQITTMLQALRNGDDKLKIEKVAQADVLAKLNELEATFKEMQQAMTAADRNPRLNGELLTVSEKFYQLAQEAEEAASKHEAGEIQYTQAEVLAFSLINLVAIIAIWFVIERIAKTLTGSTSTLASTSTQIASAVEQQERYLADQAASVNETTTTMEELGASSRQAAEQADASAAGAQQALSISGDGSKIVTQTIEGITELQQKVGAIADRIMQLSEQTSQISSISDMVADIASQTNMLSLNAAVEAARAGEQGKGFAVVAGEVRKLAEQSKKSAEKINALVIEVQSSINSTVMVTDEGTKTAQAGIRMAQDTASAFNGIARSVNDVFLNSQQIALSAKQQAVAVQQAISAMNAINLGAQETASGVTQVKVATKDLATTAKELKAIV